ncbi:hypothetical protein [Bernardetia sp.]|uniref:hypothetical protein n=1 Tax=Bernardetia sp. TaxID=1937974 RepID=UPI0025BB2CE3|nr:hypothetical protein [Bernardetia sp.]
MNPSLTTSQLRKVFYLALSLWSIAIFVNVLTLLNIDVADSFPFVWGLHLGIFAIILPIILSQAGNIKHQNTNKKQKLNLISVFKGAPIWLPIIVVGSILYAIIGFFVFNDGSLGGTADFRDGQYIVHNRGTFVKTITKEQYHIYNAEVLQGFSIVWIWFYGLGAAMLHKIIRMRKSSDEKSITNDIS